jgi:hypothetical protein
MVSSLGHKLVSSASVAGRLGAIAGPVSYQTVSCRTSCALFVAIDARFKYWFVDALGSIAFRPLSTLYYAGVGMDADIPLGFTVKIFTAGSLVRALGNSVTTEKLLKSDDMIEDPTMVRQLEYLLFRLGTLSFDAFTRIC